MTKHDSQHDAPLALTEIYDGRKVFIMGSTGFLGKVFLAMLLHRFPNVGRVYVMVRAGSGTDPQTRFERDVVGSPVFDVLRERYGGALEGMLRDKVRVVGGDITEEHLGYGEEQAQAIADDIDVIINSSGKVTFNPALDQSLRTNVVGTKNVIAFAKRMKRPCLIHVSTCFVAGNNPGTIWEDTPVVGYFPRQDELEAVTFSAEQEIIDCGRLAERVRERARDAVVAAELRSAARHRLRDEGRDPDDERYLKLAEARERKNWVRQQLSDLGMERSERWGWPNIYCYSKSLAEQLVAAEDDIVRSIVRPSVVESSEAFPFPGWNEGFTTSAPIVFVGLKGQNIIPCDEQLALDMIPVDHVAAGLLMVAAQACIEQPKLVHHLASTDTNPLRMQQLVTLLGLHKRRHFQNKAAAGSRSYNELLARMEAKPASPAQFKRSSAPLFRRLAQRTNALLDRARPAWGGDQVADIVDNLKRKVDRVEQVTKGIEDLFEIYKPFIADNKYTFRADNIRALAERVPVEQRQLAPWTIDKLDWHSYILDVHYPGLHKWVLPELEAEFGTQPKVIYTYNHLVELFDTTSKLHANRVAMRMQRDGHKDQYTYGELQEIATRVAGFLATAGVASGDRVMLLSENQPEWGMAYFGVLKAGATCVPIEKESSVEQVQNLARAGRVKGVLVSDALAQEHEGLGAALAELDNVELWTFSNVFALLDEQEELRRKAMLPDRIRRDDVASLIFTSGTTGKPKGVMLTHRNLSFMVSELRHVFDVSPRDGMLSVLPLHHTFEFSAGLLMPLAGGALVTYLKELNSDSIAAALREGRTTGIIGVPALWDLLYRRIRSRLGDGPVWLETLLQGMIHLNSWIQKRSPFDLGRLLFLVVHHRFGGRIRYLVSGGSALGDHVKKLFHGLGMPIVEGYGLTESSPVLTVGRPDSKLLLGSVGAPLPHVDVEILDPDEGGVGEVIARGHNVMAGYFEDEGSTAATVRDGWLHTGDLGRLDEDGNLYIVGRSKDVIVDANGKNVYPDELEELYGDHPLIKELSVVGLPDTDGTAGTPAERVAALVVPDYEHDAQLSRAEVQQQVHDHLREVSASLPFYKRIKAMHLWDRELPRTSTRKIKRREVIDELLRLQRVVESASGVAAGPENSKQEWLADVVAGVCGKPRARVTMASRLDALGFDSLMYTELAVALEAAGGTLKAGGDLTGIETMQALAEAVERAPRGRALVRHETDVADVENVDEEVEIPQAVVRWGQRLLKTTQRLAYDVLLDTRVEGKSYIPYHTNFIVAPNHCSHADIGLVKMALGDAGENVCALAASDYFFDTKWKRALFENFTTLVPIDRSGSLRKSLRRAMDLLQEGYSLLIFAEGTRSLDGEMADFKPTIGYMAMQARVPVLPMYLRGTADVLPKGAWMIKSRDVGAQIGQLLTVEDIEQLVDGLSRAEAYRTVATVTQRLVEGLRDGIARPTIAELRRSLGVTDAKAAKGGTRGSSAAAEPVVAQSAKPSDS